MRTPPSSEPGPDEALRSAVVAFLRDWLPDAAIAEYRRMITADPERWSDDPHFRGGIIPHHALRGNGIDEKLLRVRDLNSIWPELLREAVLGSLGDESGGGVEDVEPEAG